jgi:hypothetical protein
MLSDVGGYDNLLESAFVDNGNGDELDWIQDYFNDDTLTITESEIVSGSWDVLEDQPYGFFAELVAPYEYYFIKIGTGNFPTGSLNGDHFLYQNVGDLDYAVVNGMQWFNSLDGVTLANINFGRISHTEGVGAAPVPEPSTIVLMGLGLVGLAGLGKKKFRQ